MRNPNRPERTMRRRASDLIGTLGFAAAVAVAAAASAVAPAGALPIAPVRDQREANTFTTSFQQVPDVDRAADGESVVVWESYGSPGNDGSARSVQARRYGRSGDPAGAQFQVNTTIAGEQSAPRVAVAPDGRFAVVWQSDEGGGGPVDLDIRCRIYAANGTPVGPDFVVNSEFTLGDQRSPDVAWSGNAMFVVVWESDDDVGTGFDWNIVGRAWDGLGQSLSNEFLVNVLGGSQLDPAIAGNDVGFVVAWESSTSSGADSGTNSIQARWLGGAAEEQVNSRTPEVADDNPAVALSPEGDIVIAWESWGTTPGGTDTNRISIQARLYAATTTAPFQVNTYTIDDQRFPAVAFHSDGRFAVAWQSYGSSGSDASDWSVQIRAFDAAANPLGPDFQANTYTAANQIYPALATDARGDFALVWESFGSPGGDGDSSVQWRRFSLDLLLLATFEGGSLAEWSAHVP